MTTIAVMTASAKVSPTRVRDERWVDSASESTASASERTASNVAIGAARRGGCPERFHLGGGQSGRSLIERLHRRSRDELCLKLSQYSSRVAFDRNPRPLARPLLSVRLAPLRADCPDRSP